MNTRTVLSTAATSFLFAALVGTTQAQLIQPVSQQRVVQATATATPAGGPASDDIDSESAPGFGVFDEVVSASTSMPPDASAASTANQTSSLVGNAIVATGSFVAQPEANVLGASAEASGSSYLSITFDLFVPTSFTLTGEVNQTGAAALTRLTGPNGQVAFVLTFDGPVPVNESGSLVPGRYTLEAQAAGIANANFQNQGEAVGDFTIHFAVTSEVPSFCDAGDGSLASCPCGNPGSPDTGCDNAQATGGVGLELIAQQTNPNSATWQGTGYPTNGTPAAILLRSETLDGGSPVVFGDGLRCVATPTVRLGAAFAIGGTSNHTHGHSAGLPGTHYYQLWFRSQPAAFCDPASAFNLSNGRIVVW